MPRFSLDLPFFVPMEDGAYTINLWGYEAVLWTLNVPQEALDARLGAIRGNFGFERDPMGLLRFTRLEAELNFDDLRSLAHTFGGGQVASLHVSDVEAQGRLVLQLFNQFLDRYRIANRAPDVRPIGPTDLAFMRVEDDRHTSDFRLYGGGIGAPMTRLSSASQEKVERSLAAPDGPATYELSALQALHALNNGISNEAVLLAAGALELAIDVYLARLWRTTHHPGGLKSAANEIGVKFRNSVKTIDDILEIGNISGKLKSTPIARFVNSPESKERLDRALEARNVVAHSGVRIPVNQASRHVIAMTDFVLDCLAPALLSEFPRMPRQEFLYAYEEAMGEDYLPQLETISSHYLGGARLSAKLYNHKSEQESMFSDRYGDVVVMRVAFDDLDAGRIAHFIGSSILHHWLEVSGTTAYARPASSLVNEADGAFWEAVATELTRSVQEVAINLKLAELGLSDVVNAEVDRQSSELSKRYDDRYSPPQFGQIDFYVEYLALARVAALMDSSSRQELLTHSATVAPRVVAQVRRCVSGMENARLDDPSSILQAMVDAHDAHESILASVAVHDPVTHRDFGLGLRLGDLRAILVRHMD